MKGKEAGEAKSGAAVVVGAVLLLVLPIAAPLVHGQGNSYVITPLSASSGAACQMISGQWQASGTCAVQGASSLPSGDTLVVDQGAELDVTASAAFADSGSLQIAGGTAIFAGSVTVTPQGTLQDNGTLVVSAGGSMTNSGFLTALAVGGNMTNAGNITNTQGGTIIVDSPQASSYTSVFFSNVGQIENLGQIQVYADLTNGAQGTLVNSGDLYLASHVPNEGGSSAPTMVNAGLFQSTKTGTVTLSGETVNNTGLFTTSGTMTEALNVYTVVNNMGVFLNNGTLTNEAFFANQEQGNFTNQGSVNNDDGCAIAACGSFSNKGIMANEARGVFDNDGNLGTINSDLRRPELGSIENAGVINNLNVVAIEQGGSLVNNGTIVTSGTVTNDGAFSNSGSLENSGTIVNLTDVVNGANGTILNARTITNSGDITNDGAITETCGGVIDGAGTLEGNPVTATSTCTSFTPAPEFPGYAGALGTLLGLLGVATLAARALGGRREAAPERRKR